jgi:hypothetical protein
MTAHATTHLAAAVAETLRATGMSLRSSTQGPNDVNQRNPVHTTALRKQQTRHSISPHQDGQSGSGGPVRDSCSRPRPLVRTAQLYRKSSFRLLRPSLAQGLVSRLDAVLRPSLACCPDPRRSARVLPRCPSSRYTGCVVAKTTCPAAVCSSSPLSESYFFSP